MTVQLGPVPSPAAGQQPNMAASATAALPAAVDRPALPAETAATARAVDPPQGAARPVAVPNRDLPPLIPPDPQAPAGPPPAFEASILDRARQAPTDTADATSEPEPTEPPMASEARLPDSAEAQGYEVPPSAEERTETEIATVRRMETPYDTATVDVSR